MALRCVDFNDVEIMLVGERLYFVQVIGVSTVDCCELIMAHVLALTGQAGAPCFKHRGESWAGGPTANENRDHEALLWIGGAYYTSSRKCCALAPGDGLMLGRGCHSRLLSRRLTAREPHCNREGAASRPRPKALSPSWGLLCRVCSLH